MGKKGILEKLSSEALRGSPSLRKAYLKGDFYEFAQFYFPEFFTFDTPQFLRDYADALDSGKNIYFKGYRGCSKTTYAQVYIDFCITNKTRRNIMWYSQTIDNAEENLTYISNGLIGGDDSEVSRLVKDYGQLYYDEASSKYGDKKMKRTNKFITENNVYVRAMSLGTSPRGKNYTAPDGKRRPDLIVFDDVDTLDSVSSTKKIDKNFKFMLNEVLGGTTSACQMIFLGNVIYEDGLVPRFEKHIENDSDWIILDVSIYDNKGNITWNRFVETDKEMDKLNQGIRDSNKKYTSLETERRRLGSISFNQNYLLIPQVLGQQIITRDMLRSFKYSPSNYGFDYIQVGVDPAISEKDGTDRFAITVTGFDGDKKYVLEAVKLEGKMKNIKRASQVVKNLYDKRNANRVLVETVAYQAVLKTVFKDMGMATEGFKTHRDKVTRLLEHQALFEDGKVFFNIGLTEDLVQELIGFPSGEYDDLVDSMVFSFFYERRKFYIASA